MNHETISDPAARFQSTRTLATTLGVRPETIRKWAAEGRIPFVRLSARAMRFDQSAVLLALASPKVEGAKHGQ